VEPAWFRRTAIIDNAFADDFPADPGIFMTNTSGMAGRGAGLPRHCDGQAHAPMDCSGLGPMGKSLAGDAARLLFQLSISSKAVPESVCMERKRSRIEKAVFQGFLIA
jgi:hypothetical protein